VRVYRGACEECARSNAGGLFSASEQSHRARVLKSQHTLLIRSTPPHLHTSYLSDLHALHPCENANKHVCWLSQVYTARSFYLTVALLVQTEKLITDLVPLFWYTRNLTPSSPLQPPPTRIVYLVGDFTSPFLESFTSKVTLNPIVTRRTETPCHW
jgi:hypothetical protein